MIYVNGKKNNTTIDANNARTPVLFQVLSKNCIMVENTIQALCVLVLLRIGGYIIIRMSNILGTKKINTARI